MLRLASTALLRRTSLALAAASLAACGADEPVQPTASSVPTAGPVVKATVTDPTPAAPRFEPLDLVPADAVAVIRLRSIGEVDELLRRLSAMLERSGVQADLPSTARALHQLGVDPKSMRGPDAVVVSFSLPEGSTEPVATAYIPGAAIEDRTRRKSKATPVAGGYVAVTKRSLEPGEPAPPSWVADLPDGLFALRVDAATLTERLAPLAQLAMAQMMLQPEAARNVQSQMNAQQEELLEFLAKAEWIDIACDVENDLVRTSIRTLMKDGALADLASDAPGALRHLAPHLDCDAPFVLANVFDVEHTRDAALEQLDAAIAEMPDLLRGRVADAYGAVLDFVGSFDPGLVCQIDPTPGRLYASFIFRSEKKGAARDAFGQLLSEVSLEDLGFEFSLPKRKRIGSAIVEDYTFRFNSRVLDFDQRAALRDGFGAFFGDPEMHLKIATAGPYTMFVLGGDTPTIEKRIRAFSHAEEVPVELIGLVEELDGIAPASIARFDGLRLAALVAELGATAAGVSASAARREMFGGRDIEDGLEVLMWTGTRPSEGFFGFEVEMAAIERTVEAFTGDRR